MTDRAKTIEMARQAGFNPQSFFMESRLERFAALVRDQVIEEAAQKCEEAWEDIRGTALFCAAFIRGMKSDPGHSTARAGEASTWQPFDTAPQDGEIFLALNHDREAWVATYITKEGPPRLAYRTNGLRESKRYRVHEIDGKRLMEELESSESWDSNWTYWSRGYTFKPTHWTPLPGAPRCRSADNAVTGLMSPEGVSPAPAPDLAALLDEAREALIAARDTLAMLTDLSGIQQSNVQQAWAAAVAAGVKARAAISRIDAVRKEKP